MELSEHFYLLRYFINRIDSNMKRGNHAVGRLAMCIVNFIFLIGRCSADFFLPILFETRIQSNRRQDSRSRTRQSRIGLLIYLINKLIILKLGDKKLHDEIERHEK